MDKILALLAKSSLANEPHRMTPKEPSDIDEWTLAGRPHEWSLEGETTIDGEKAQCFFDHGYGYLVVVHKDELFLGRDEVWFNECICVFRDWNTEVRWYKQLRTS